MSSPFPAPAPPVAASLPTGTVRPPYSAVLRALREARGVTQEGWAAQLGVSRGTVQRWETGAAVPTAEAEQALLAYCRDTGLFRTFHYEPLAGQPLTPELLGTLLADGRLGVSGGPRAVGSVRPWLPGRLVVHQGAQVGTAYAVGEGVTTIGRGAANTIAVADQRVSRQHAEVCWEGTQYVLRDLGSKNGTFLNGRRVLAPQVLQHGDVIALADLVLVFEATDSTLTDGQEPEATGAFRHDAWVARA